MWGEGVECVQRSSRKYGERQTKDRQMDRERGRLLKHMYGQE